jgi:hypothetical protein
MGKHDYIISNYIFPMHSVLTAVSLRRYSEHSWSVKKFNEVRERRQKFAVSCSNVIYVIDFSAAENRSASQWHGISISCCVDKEFIYHQQKVKLICLSSSVNRRNFMESSEVHWNVGSDI